MKKLLFPYLSISLILFFSGLLIISSCKKDDEPENPIPPTYTNGQGEIGEIGGTITVNDVSSPLNGVTAKIPEGALSSSQVISIKKAHDSITFPGDTTAIVIEMFPHGLEFEQPVEISFPLGKNAKTDYLLGYYIDYENDEIVQLPTDVDIQNSTITISTNHFSYFLVSDKGVHANVDMYNINNKAAVILYVDGWQNGVNYGFDGIPSRKMLVTQGIFSAKQIIDEFNPLLGGNVVSYFNLKLKKKNNYWTDPQIEEKTILLKRIGVKGQYGVEVYESSLNPDNLKLKIESLDDNLREIFFKGEALFIDFETPLKGNKDYYIVAKWGITNGIQPLSLSHRFTRIYKINNCDYAMNSSQMATLDLDKNNNYVRDIFEPTNPNNSPYASFIVTPNSGSANTTFQFDASASTDSKKKSRSIIEYDWDWDNNGIVDYTSYSPTVTHKYDNEGSYTVKLTVYDDGELPGSTTRMVNVTNGSTPPTANFTINPSTGNTSTNFSFNASSSSSNAKYFRWDFNNDGNWDSKYSTSASITHKFNYAGSYNTKLEVKSNENLLDQKIINVVVSEPSALTVTNPNSSTTWEMGDNNVPISWETGDLGGDVKLQLYKGNNKLGTLTPSGTPNDGSYNEYDVQTTLSEGDDYRIKILWVADESKFDFSDYFSIVETANLPPTEPKDEYPTNGATGIELNDALFWTSSDQEGDPIKYDIYFGTSSNPSLVVSNVTDNFYSLSNLNVISNTTYYWKIVAKDDQGNSTTGPIWSFSTQSNGSAPIANFSADITSGTAPLTVNFTDQSTNTPTSWQWDFGDGGTSTQQNPSYTYNTDGSYTVSLTVNNEYGSDTKTKTGYIYVGSGSGGEPCPGTPTVTDADGNVYNTVQIGGQCWMKENLRVGIRIDGSQEMTNNSIIEKYCSGDDPANCETYGGLYQWDEMMQYTTTEGTQGICPDGWHIPTDEEWKILEGTVDSQYGVGNSEWDKTSLRGFDAGKNLKSTSGWNNNGNGTNDYGFSDLPGGYRQTFGNFIYLGSESLFWSSNEYSSSKAWLRVLFSDYDEVSRAVLPKGNGQSVRCIKD